jgi:hypothetical protein
LEERDERDSVRGDRSVVAGGSATCGACQRPERGRLRAVALRSKRAWRDGDFELSDVKAVLVRGAAKTAVVDARFKNFGKMTFVTYDLVRDRHGWMIDEMRSGCYVLSEALQQKSKC